MDLLKVEGWSLDRGGLGGEALKRRENRSGAVALGSIPPQQYYSAQQHEEKTLYLRCRLMPRGRPSSSSRTITLWEVMAAAIESFFTKSATMWRLTSWSLP